MNRQLKGWMMVTLVVSVALSSVTSAFSICVDESACHDVVVETCCTEADDQIPCSDCCVVIGSEAITYLALESRLLPDSLPESDLPAPLLLSPRALLPVALTLEFSTPDPPPLTSRFLRTLFERHLV